MHSAEFAAEFGIPVWLGLATMLTQLISGILLILGALTPLAALGIAGTMFPATIFLIKRGEPFINPAGHSWENSAFYLMAGICLALSGAGRWSVDAWLFGRRGIHPALAIGPSGGRNGANISRWRQTARRFSSSSRELTRRKNDNRKTTQ